MGSEPGPTQDLQPEDEQEALLGYREREEIAAEAEAEPVAETAAAGDAAAAARISKRAFDLIVEYETGGRAYYEQKYKSRPVWPKASSGITIGCGYDLGYVGRAEFEADWAALLATLPAAQRTALTACLGFHSGKHSAAQMQALLASVRDVVVPWDSALAVFARSTLPKFAGLTERALPNCGLLNGDCFGALVSLTFNRGASYSKAHNPAKDPLDRYREMRAIKAAMQARAFAGIPAQIRAMIRIWVGTAIETGMRRRRTDEATLFAEGLATEALAPSVAEAPQAESAAAPMTVAFLSDRDPPEGAESWDGPSDEDFWDETTEDDVAAEAAETIFAGSRAPGATWAPDAVQPDYSHLGADLPTGGAFSLRSEDLALLARLNDFDVGALGNGMPILFGLRGAAIVKDHRDPAGIVLIDQRPDHITPRCVIGVWNRAAGTVSVFQGSTVPNQAAVAKYKRERTAGNLLPTGLYHYVCGAHTTERQSTPGAFLLRKPDMSKRVVIVRRSVDDLSYERTDMVHRFAPGDNIHPTFWTSPTAFSSLGCQTVVGTYKDGAHVGPWSRFRAAAGFTDNDGEPGERFLYMLLTGAEARIASQLRTAGLTGDAAALRRLRRIRFGSTGAAARRLQERLGLPDPDSAIGPTTAESLYARQAQLGSPAGGDGIYSPALDQALGWDVLA